MAEAGPTVKATPVKGYARLPLWLRSRMADGICALALMACVIALFASPAIEGVWLRLPVLLALILVILSAWVLYRRPMLVPSLSEKLLPVIRGGLVVALIGLSMLAMALHHASGFASLAGLLAFVAALALRGSVEKALIRGRDLRTLERKPLAALFENIESLAAALVIVLLVWHFGLEAFRIPSGSMAPTLLGDPVWGDRVLVDKFAYQIRDPQRWEPVVFRYPLRRGEPYVKRCVALPGEQVLIAQGDVYIKRHDNAEIELLTKSKRAREVLWLPYIGAVRDNTDWVRNFHREGAAEFIDGRVRLGEGAAATFPRGRGAAPGDAVDHDASFGATETPAGFFGANVVGDLRVRATALLAEGNGVAVTLMRDADEYTLELRTGAGGAKLFHAEQGSAERAELSAEGLEGFTVPQRLRFEFSLADGELELVANGRVVAVRHVGTPLLQQLRARDAEKRIRLDEEVALRMAHAAPPLGKRGRVVLRGLQGGGELQVQGIERDVYYLGRMLDEPTGRTDLPLGIALEDDHYFVLGDNSPGSLDARAWTRITLFMNDGTQVTGSLDGATQPALTQMLMRAESPGDPFNAMAKLQRVAHFAPTERDPDRDDDLALADAKEIAEALRMFKEAATGYGRGAIDFWTEGGGYVRVRLQDVDHFNVSAHPYVQRRLFVGRPFAVFLSPRGMNLID